MTKSSASRGEITESTKMRIAETVEVRVGDPGFRADRGQTAKEADSVANDVTVHQATGSSGMTLEAAKGFATAVVGSAISKARRRSEGSSGMTLEAAKGFATA